MCDELLWIEFRWLCGGVTGVMRRMVKEAENGSLVVTGVCREGCCGGKERKER